MLVHQHFHIVEIGTFCDRRCRFDVLDCLSFDVVHVTVSIFNNLRWSMKHNFFASSTAQIDIRKTASRLPIEQQFHAQRNYIMFSLQWCNSDSVSKHHWNNKNMYINFKKRSNSQAEQHVLIFLLVCYSCPKKF